MPDEIKENIPEIKEEEIKEEEIKKEIPTPDPIDSRVLIDVDTNFKDAKIEVIPPHAGGKELTADEIIKELEKRNIIFGVDINLIHRIVDGKLYDTAFVVAKYLPPVDGENGSVKYLFEKENMAKPKEKEDGTVDYKDIGVYRTVTENTVIAEITHPTEGTPGMDIKKKVVKNIPGKKADYSIGQNTALSQDGLRIVATADGVLNWNRACFNVETTMTVDEVGPATGNIDFIGDVIVKGDVIEGFSIKAEKSITIYGNTSKAKLTAGKGINIKGGCLFSKLTAKGNIVATFFESAEISCEGDITSTSFQLCKVSCGGNVIMKGNGVVAGGVYSCRNSIELNVLGSKSFTKTDVTVGMNTILRKEKNSLLSAIQEIEEKIVKYDQVIKILMEMRKDMGGKLTDEKQELFDKSYRERMVMKKEISDMNKRIEQIDSFLTEKQYLQVSVKNMVYPGVVIHIEDYKYTVNSVMGKCRFYLGEDGIEFGA
ncbi:MAG: FapA family protein [Ruminococcus sp.]|nr:FapA family protein [Ruminococcus sp.]